VKAAAKANRIKKGGLIMKKTLCAAFVLALCVFTAGADARVGTGFGTAPENKITVMDVRILRDGREVEEVLTGREYLIAVSVINFAQSDIEEVLFRMDIGGKAYEERRMIGAGSHVGFSIPYTFLKPGPVLIQASVDPDNEIGDGVREDNSRTKSTLVGGPSILG